MRIHNIRLGFANNSSSSHSLIFLPDAAEDHYGYFGQNDFVLTSIPVRLQYVGAQIFENICRSCDSRIATQIIDELFADFGGTPTDVDVGVDHQSLHVLPRDFLTGSGVDLDFAAEFRDFYLQKNLVVLGGYDGSDPHPLDNDTSFVLAIPQDGYRSYVCRKDPVYNYWTLFNQNSGAKIRMSFDDEDGYAKVRQVWNGEEYENQRTPFNVTKAYAPELVDIKITDACPFAVTAPCGVFCYQNSGPRGKHASLADIEHIADALAEMRVFEVALGGGETTLHPDFIEVLRIFRARGIVPNFTTRNTGWLRDEDTREEIFGLMGSFAYSVTSAHDVVSFIRLFRDHCGVELSDHTINRVITMQYVMGSQPADEFRKLIKALETTKKTWSRWAPITLLGYKTSGRGHEFKPHDYSGWRTILQELKVRQVRIDTALATEYDEVLSEELPDWMYHTEEGKFSMYVDAVNGVMGPSSFCEETQMVPFDMQNGVGQKVQKVFQAF